ncbi:MAG: hypothetical protein QHH17_02620 [Candidatus Bathyarchaeota archaeon]|jgi:hypothetical protein|nr:hypothetical protein [Candidatus Bathyarchaeota archaeon]
MTNQFKNVLNWKQKMKLLGFIKNSYVKDDSVNLACVETDTTRNYEIMCARLELEKAKASAFQFIRTAA